MFLKYAEFMCWIWLHLPLMNYSFLKVEGDSGAVNDMANTMMQKLWYSACSFEPADEEYDTHRCFTVSFLVMFVNCQTSSLLALSMLFAVNCQHWWHPNMLKLSSICIPLILETHLLSKLRMEKDIYIDLIVVSIT